MDSLRSLEAVRGHLKIWKKQRKGFGKEILMCGFWAIQSPFRLEKKQKIMAKRIFG
jgi:hypothetical protein